ARSPARARIRHSRSRRSHSASERDRCTSSADRTRTAAAPYSVSEPSSLRIHCMMKYAWLIPLLTGCAATEALRAPAMKPIAEQVKDDRFKRDTAGSISEEDLQKLLATLPLLDEKSRLGVVPVASGYEPNGELPLPEVPAEL